jgi:hypothetical protein
MPALLYGKNIAGGMHIKTVEIRISTFQLGIRMQGEIGCKK